MRSRLRSIQMPTSACGPTPWARRRWASRLAACVELGVGKRVALVGHRQLPAAPWLPGPRTACGGRPLWGNLAAVLFHPPSSRDRQSRSSRRRSHRCADLDQHRGRLPQRGLPPHAVRGPGSQGARRQWRWPTRATRLPTPSSTHAPTGSPIVCAPTESDRRRSWAFCMERSLDLIVGLLGILKAGGALRAARSLCASRAASLDDLTTRTSPWSSRTRIYGRSSPPARS